MGIRIRVVAGLAALFMSSGTAAYACLCCPWTEVTACQARDPYHPSCTYPAAVPGDIAARGSWQVDIHRGAQVLHYAGHGPGPATYPGAIQAGDLVNAVASDNSCVTAGENDGQYLPC